MQLLWIVCATAFVSLGSLIGIFTISINPKILYRFLLPMVALSAGTLLAGAFVHLLPESILELGIKTPLIITMFAFIGFFLIEKTLRWRHCHDESHCETHTLGYMNLIGDIFHNILDGAVIAGAFVTSFNLGLVTTFAIIMHELPQEIGDFGVLLHSGFSRSRALILNLLVGLSSVLGGVIGYYATEFVVNLSPYLLAFAAGGFIYIAASDLVPEMQKCTSFRKTASLLFTFFLGVTIMFLIKD